MTSYRMTKAEHIYPPPLWEGREGPCLFYPFLISR